jgi:hypothetical protein
VAAVQSLMANQEPSEGSKDVQRKRDKRTAAAEVSIPPVVDPERRRACLADPVLFLRTYNGTGEEGFTTPFAKHHLAMIDAIHQRAMTGGDKAVAAPRGDGKSTVAVWMLIYVILAGHCRSAVIIAATRKHAQKLFKRLKKAFLFNDLLAGDFPEISACVRDLDGAPQRAAKQHVDGEKTQIVWTQDDVAFPHAPKPYDEAIKYGGIRLAYFGLDSAIRGGRFEFALIDDPETREVANSDEQHLNIEAMIDSDVAGLAFPDSTISRVILTTVQNRRCYSYRVTNAKIKPAFAGECFGVLESWPTNRELWDEYIFKRQTGQEKGDKDGREAMQFYLDNREAMQAGAVVSNPYRFNRKSETEVDALQAFFNRVADWKLPRVLAELQNDPEEDIQEMSLALTAGKVQTRISGLMQHELPRADNLIITCGLDIGNTWSHWVKVAWFGNATGVIVDYGVAENPGAKAGMSQAILDATLLPSLHQWRTDILSQNQPDFCLIDSGSGTHSEIVYEFVRQVGGVPFEASKGWDKNRFKIGVDSDSRRCYYECAAEFIDKSKVWLYHVNTEFWKQWLQERFITPTFDEAMQFNDGSLSLYACPNNPKQHLSISKHIVAEERVQKFIEGGKGLVTKWVQKSSTNHYLDALALSCAAAGVMGVRLIRRESLIVPEERTVQRDIPKEYSDRFRTRPGGWVQGAR